MHFFIQSKTGRLIADYTGKDEESEVLFLPGTKFEVLDYKEIKNDKDYGDFVEIRLREI